MATTYDGVPGNIVVPSALTIASSTATNPCVITVSGSLPPDFFTGCLVHITDHPTNTAANGIWSATVTGASTFTIPVAGTAISGGGLAIPLNLTPSFTIPSDGDLANEASIDTLVKVGADRAQFLASKVGQFKLARREIFQNQAIGTASWTHWPAGAVTAGTPVQFTGDSATWATLIGGSVQTPTAGPGNTVFAIDGVVAGDFVSVKLVTTAVVASQHAITLYGAILPFGSIPAWPANYGRIGGSSAVCDAAGTGNATSRNVTCEGVLANVASQSGVAWVQPILWPLTTGSPTIQLIGEAMLTIDIWRPTGVNQ